MDDELQRTRRAYGDQCLERCRTIATSATWAKQMTHYNKSPVRPTLIAQAKLAMQRMVQVFSQHLSPQNATSVDKGIIGALLGENVTIVIVSSLGVALAHHYNDRPVPHIQAPGDVAAALSSVWYIAANSLLELVPSVLVAMAEYHRSLPLDLVRSTWRSLVAILEIAFAKPPSGGGSRSGTITQYQVRLLNVVLSESLKFINRIIGTTRGQVDASDVGGQEAVSRDDGQLLTIDDFNADWERIVSLLDQGVAMPSIFGIPYSVSITTARPVPDLSVELVSLVWMFALTGDFMPDSELDSLLDDGDQRHRDYLAEFEQYQSVIVDGGETASRKSRFPAVPVEISRIVAPVLMQRSALIISHCICSYRTLGGCPPPRYYTEDFMGV
ncbi:hypothetical protein EV182_001647 [Spiromyces aspiralis]|uniref:Uncharacterized protein n=1 Tax=Spiromyces aspiralis TaxID=68401 RepID=A0ACC1HTQ7_9FUNG|nr:hypothetical protein EV182_001647 [Spiromyces aspiralis]